jgi:hypothetical protein
MNCGAATAFLPNFVGFPSLRGLHSSTVQPRRAPGRPGRAPELCYAHRARHAERGRGVRSSGTPRPLLPRPPCPPGADAVPPSGSSAAPCQLPPPHPPPPPPQDDEPPPQDELPPPQEWPPDEPPSCDDPEPPSLPARPPATHQLVSLPLPLWLLPEDRRPWPPPRPTGRTVCRRRLEPMAANTPTRTKQTTARMMPMTMASPSFRFPRSGPPWAPRLVRAVEMPLRLTAQSRVEELQSLSAG